MLPVIWQHYKNFSTNNLSLRKGLNMGLTFLRYIPTATNVLITQVALFPLKRLRIWFFCRVWEVSRYLNCITDLFAQSLSMSWGRSSLELREVESQRPEFKILMCKILPYLQKNYCQGVLGQRLLKGSLHVFHKHLLLAKQPKTKWFPACCWVFFFFKW